LEGAVLSVGAAIYNKRTRLGLTAKEVAKRAHLSPSYVSKVENGECEPSVRTFGAIAGALRMNAHEVWLAVMAEAATKLSQGRETMDTNVG
jgi:transcriptional regulator with XRE-family HTH domain